MKTNKILKVTSIVMAIIILIMVSFVGIYVKDNGRLTNILKDFTKGAEFGVEKEFVMSVSDNKTTEYYDSEGQLVLTEDVDTNATEGTYTTKEVAVNSDELKTVENYKTVKKIMEKRIKDLGLEEYTLTLDEKTGDIVLKTLSKEQDDSVIYAIYGQGEFLLKDAETQEVLLNNNDIKDSRVAYYTTEQGTNVYLTIDLNKEGKEKLKEISANYVKSTRSEVVTADDGTVSQEEKEVTKNVKLYIDGNLIVNTYFGEQITNGQLQLTMGSAVSSVDELQSLLLSASVEATKLSNGAMPLIYEVTQSGDIMSYFDKTLLTAMEVVAVIALTLVLLYFVLRYKERAIMSSILLVGFAALYILVLRYANVAMTAASIAGFVLVEALTVFFMDSLLSRLKKYNIDEETPKSIIDKAIFRNIMVMMPVLIVSVVFSLFTSLWVSSLGIALFWGIALFNIYSYVIVKTLLLNFEYLFENK